MIYYSTSKSGSYPLEPEQDAIIAEAEMHNKKAFAKNAYTGGELVWNQRPTSKQANWTQRISRVASHNPDAITWCNGLIQDIMGNVDEQLVNAAYIYGAGIDLDWETL